MNRSILSFALALATVFAGCLGPRVGAGDAGALAPAEGTGNVTLLPEQFTLRGCEEIRGVFVVPASFATDVPQGFHLATDPSGQLALLLVLGWKCADAAIPGNATEGGDVALVGGLVVLPSAEYVRDDAAYHFLLTGYTTANRAIAEILQDWNVSAREPARKTVLDFIVGGPVRRGIIELDEVRLEVEAAGREGAFQGDVVRFLKSEGGAVAGGFDLAWSDGTALSDANHAHLAFEDSLPGGLPLVFEGLGVHVWGKDYAYNVTRAKFKASADAGSANPDPVSGRVLDGPLSRLLGR